VKPVILLRTAAVLAFLHGVLHTIGGVFASPAPGAQADAAAVMKANHFDALGASRTYWDFFLGFGLLISITFFVEAAVFWQLGSLAKTTAKTNSTPIRPMLAAFCVGYIASAVVSARYFFSVPAAMELVIAACLAGAFITARKSANQD
jgi:hypothetical protein